MIIKEYKKGHVTQNRHLKLVRYFSLLVLIVTSKNTLDGKLNLILDGFRFNPVYFTHLANCGMAICEMAISQSARSRKSNPVNPAKIVKTKNSLFFH